MTKILCLCAVICVTVVLGEECFDKKVLMEKSKKIHEACSKEVDRNSEHYQLEFSKCIMWKQGIVSNKTTAVPYYHKVVAKLRSDIVSKNKRKVVLDGVEKCKNKFPDLERDFSNCYIQVLQKECFPK